MDDAIFKHLLDSERLLKSRADEIKRKKGEVEGYKKDLVGLKEGLEAAETELEEKSTELSQAKYQQQTKSRQLELVSGKLGQLKKEFQCIVKEKDKLKEQREIEREEYRAKAAHYAALFTTQNEELESCDQSTLQKLRSAEAEIQTKQEGNTLLEKEQERLSAQCAEYNIKELEERRDELVGKKRDSCPVIQHPDTETLLQLYCNMEKFEREVKLMSGELLRVRKEMGRDPGITHQPVPRNEERSPYQLTPQPKTQQFTETFHFTERRCVVPSISPYFSPSFSVSMNPGVTMATTTHSPVSMTNPGVSMVTTTHSPVSDDMYDDGIVDDDLIELCNAAERLN